MKSKKTVIKKEKPVVRLEIGKHTCSTCSGGHK